MNKSATTQGQNDIFDTSSYNIETLEDEIRSDQLCRKLLQTFHQHLLQEKSIPPLEAGALAGGADFFLRDYLIDGRRKNIFRITPLLVSGFAGNWYIRSTLEPNLAELKNILKGVYLFYCYCVEKNIVSPELAENINTSCQRFDYYQERIDSFHALQGGGYSAWNQACPQDSE